MRLPGFIFAVLFTVAALFGSVHSAERHGIQVYAGARLDAEETNFLREKAGADGYCYRTGDRVEKVMAFYQRHPGVISLGSDKNGGMFVKEGDGPAVYIKVQSPWQPAKGGPMQEDTFIGITRE